VRRVYCVGRNYAEHVREFGHDPDRELPFFFMKPADALVTDGRFPYPPGSKNVHHEIELALLLGQGGRDLDEGDAASCVLAYATALDMTRRDIQAEAKAAGRPWEAAKGFDCSAPIAPAVLAAEAASKGMTRDQVYRGYAAGTSMRTFVAARDVANMAVFLASDGARYVSGQGMAVGGHTENPDPKL